MTDTKTRKKVFAEVTAFIRFELPNIRDAQQLTEHFLARRGITLVEPATHDRRSRVKTTLKVIYRVHGGWRSDFVRKIEIDAKDLGLVPQHLEVEVVRREIPTECPRKECFPCEVALDPQKAHQSADPPPLSKPKPPVRYIKVPTIEETTSKRKIFKFLGGNA